MKENKLDHLFEVARSSEPEISNEAIGTFVKGIPDGQIPSSSSLNQSLFTSKYFIMLSLIILIGSFLFFQANQIDKTVEQSLEIEAKTSFEEIYIEPTEHEIYFVEFIREPQEIASANIYSYTTISKLSIGEESISESSNEHLRKRGKTMDEKPNSTVKQSVQQGAGGIDVFPSDNDKIKMSSRDVIKLKKNLYKNLLNDDLINSKSSHVEIRLKERAILVNGKELDVTQYSKYRNLTRDAGWGEKRMIKMTEKNIRIGDFDGLNFKGVGVGRFFEPNDLSDIKQELEGKNNKKEKAGQSVEDLNREKMKKELAALNFFVDEIYGGAAGPFRKSFFLGNKYNHKVMAELHQVMYKELIELKLTENIQSMHVLELKDDGLMLNGAELNSEDENKLNIALSIFNLKRKDYRMIKMSEHSIALGDYRPGSFTGVFYLMD